MVAVIAGPDEMVGRSLPFSELSDCPYVVLLGEPGSGKSTVFETAAKAASRSVTIARALRVSGGQHVESPLFVDALDEDRSEGSKKDKIFQLRDKMLSSSLECWRISCRVEDWRGAADLSALQAATTGAPIVVTQLQNLSVREQAKILTSRGALDPEGFIGQARRHGAASFLECPSSDKMGVLT
ncbi:hypothetical protein CVT23_03325 [Minwuia thermotolerans]|uniref:Uncharacterized protein n=2 Tax=Minwuia thermotolerans TaxID=2056226 RepID=A0A2M9G5W0_9PROT|nr:hypothetical protein CVT23_03325 [Minwuia thermotolerans]